MLNCLIRLSAEIRDKGHRTGLRQVHILQDYRYKIIDMKKTDRRRFLQTSAAGLAGLAAISGMKRFDFPPASETIDMVKLGNTGLMVPRVALGTGSAGWKKESNQTRLGYKKFVELSQYAYDRGIKFFDTADMYGSHPYVREALKVIPRENVTILTKVMTYGHEGWYTVEPFQTSLDRFRKEVGTDYFDIFLLHCMMNGKWPTEYRKFMDGMSEAKEKGIMMQWRQQLLIRGWMFSWPG